MVPQLPDCTIAWADDFDGDAGSAVNAANWHHKTGENYNNELQVYTTSPSNAHLSGDGTLHIIPLKNQQQQPDGTNTVIWTSARLECHHSFTCPPGQRMRLQASIRLGSAPPQKQRGIWPAFWALGRAIETDSWPKCGECDILETVNGETWNMATVHYLSRDGGEKADRMHSQRVEFERGRWYTWALEWDRRTGSSGLEDENRWQDETITWYLDGNEWYRVSGKDFGVDAAACQQWTDLAHKPFFPLLNVAIGGDYPGPPDDEETEDGIESGMSVQYVAVYQSD